MAHPSPMITSQRNLRRVKAEHHDQNCQYGMPGTLSALYNQHIKRESDLNPCQVYVHRFNKIPNDSLHSRSQKDWQSGSQLHQNKYKHECSDSYNAKLRYCKKQFDSLTLNSKTMPINNSPYRIVKICSHKNSINENRQVPHVKSISSAKFNKSFIFKPEHKAVADKLEETYWSKWKPNKAAGSKLPCPKAKGLYTENEKLNVLCDIDDTKKKERGDSNQAIAEPILPVSELTNLSEVQANKKGQEDECKESDDDIHERDDLHGTSIIVLPESNSECDVIPYIKHTDSLILTSKKKSLEKTHYKQPKCIKLFKNTGYTTTTSTNYIKGGSYPLKSCLKRETNSKGTSFFQHSATPARSSNSRRLGKANRFTT